MDCNLIFHEKLLPLNLDDGFLQLGQALEESLSLESKINALIQKLNLINLSLSPIPIELPVKISLLNQQCDIQSFDLKDIKKKQLKTTLKQLHSILLLCDKEQEKISFSSVLCVHEKIDLILEKFLFILTHKTKNRTLQKQLKLLTQTAQTLPFAFEHLQILQDYALKAESPFFKKFFQLNLEKYQYKEDKLKTIQNIYKEEGRLSLLVKTVQDKKSVNKITSLTTDHFVIVEDIFRWNSILFMNIKARHFLYPEPIKTSTVGFDSCAKAIMDFSERLTYFICLSLISPPKKKDKIQAICHCLGMIDLLLKKEDLQGAFTLYMALNAPEVSHLSEVFNVLDEESKERLNYFSWIFSLHKNFKIYRAFLLACSHPIPIFPILIKDNAMANENTNQNEGKINLQKWKFYYGQYTLIKQLKKQHNKKSLIFDPLNTNPYPLKLTSNLYILLMKLNVGELKEQIHNFKSKKSRNSHSSTQITAPIITRKRSNTDPLKPLDNDKQLL